MNAKYKIITNKVVAGRKCLMIYLNTCELCQRKDKTVKNRLVVIPMKIYSEKYSRCQIDLFDKQVQLDGNFPFALVYYLSMFYIYH